MDGWLLAAVIGLGALAAYFAGRLVLLRRDIRGITDSFREKVNKDTRTPIGTGSMDPVLRTCADTLNEALAEYVKKRREYESVGRHTRENIADLAHDLRTPLTALLGYLDMLEEQPERVAEYAPVLRSRAELMTEVMADLFEYSLSDAGRPKQQAEPTDLRSVLEDSVIALYAQFVERGIEPALYMPDNPVLRRIDRRVLERMAGNILTNAVRHGEGDIEIRLDEDGTMTFSNRAPGVTQLDVEKLFDRFYTVQNGGRSTGLGLGIARALAREIEGDMRAELRGDTLLVIVDLPPRLSTAGPV